MTKMSPKTDSESLVSSLKVLTKSWLYNNESDKKQNVRTFGILKIVKLRYCSSLLKALNSTLKDSTQKKRSRADTIIQMQPPTHHP